MKNKILLFVFMFLISSVFAIAADTDAFSLGDIVDTISGFNIAEAYLRAPMVIDGILYFIIFIGLGMVTLSKRFEGRGGKALIVGVGLALAIAMTVWTSKTGFRLMNLGPFAGLMFAILLGFWIWKFIAGDEKAGPTFWFAIMVVYIMMYMFFPELMAILSANKWGRMLLALLSILFVIAIPLFLAGMFRGGEPGEAKGWGGVLGGGRAPTAAERKQAKKAEKEEEGLEEGEEAADIAEAKLTKDEIRLMRDLYNKIRAYERKLRTKSIARTVVPSAAEIQAHDIIIASFNEELDAMIVLDEKIKAYVKKARGIISKLYKKATTIRKRKVMKKSMAIADALHSEYATVNLIEKMIDDVKAKLDSTIGLPNLNTFAGSGPMPPQELNALKDSQKIIKKVYNRVAQLMRLQGQTINLIS
ncbi:hypothetical protein KY360_03470 [Candidatus Woesearchaeota archaeon]|nr:hypothetical protein [Candidatus Woesearchaeota archaeon]